MLKKFTALALATLVTAGFAYAQLEVTGEMKTGLYWEKVEAEGRDPEEKAVIHNADDAGPNEGRFRLNLHYIKENIGMKVRFQQTSWSSAQPNQWEFAFAYGNFIEDQLKITLGKLGESPWSAGGPDIWQELDNQIGMRTEVKPNALPGLNVGFVINTWNNSVYQLEKRTLVDILRETVVGIAYTNDYFHGRFSFRFDGEADVYNMVDETEELMYRLEERVLANFVPGLSIWVNGWWKGLRTEDVDIVLYRNWLYLQYNPDAFSSHLRLGYHTGANYQEFHSRLSFYYNIFSFSSSTLSAGVTGNFNLKTIEGNDAPNRLLSIEPGIRVTFGPNAYVLLVYSYDNESLMDSVSSDPITKNTQKMNLRAVYTF